ncbi:MAG: hypothetical protein NVV72_10235 [Asticcacaulis sp.]|nr:hypothetical protein [Asticcacaulis sp.]
MEPEPKFEDKISTGIRDILSRFKADRLALEQAEAELVALFASEGPASDPSGIGGLRTHD